MIIVHPSLPTGFSSRERVWLRGGLASLLVLAATSAVFAQQAPVDPGDATGIQTTAIQPSSTLQVNVRRVVVDVVVTDDHGVPVKNLARTDFRIFEDGKPQTLRSFEQHLAETQPPLPKPDLPPDTFSNLSSVPQSGPVTVILYDLLNTPLESQAFAHEQLLNFLRHRQSSSQVAIFVLTDKLHMLQGFTDDDNQLIAALNSQNGQRYRSSQLQAPGEATQQSDSLSRTAGNQNGADADKNASFQQVSTMLKHMETIESSALLDQRVRITVDALQEISRFLIAIPGRKNLLWLSGSFPTGVLPDDSLDSRDSFDVTRNYSETVVQATDMLNLSHVAVYPVDVRGLQVNPMFTADNNQTYEPGTNKEQQAVRNFNQHVDADHATMDGIADQTGGRAFYNTNGLAQAVATAMQDGAVYYTPLLPTHQHQARWRRSPRSRGANRSRI
jgi:VWFA-related protein